MNTAGLDDRLTALRLLMQTGKESTKNSCAATWVRAKYNVIAYFGDQLGDFSEEFALSQNATARSPA